MVVLVGGIDSDCVVCLFVWINECMSGERCKHKINK